MSKHTLESTRYADLINNSGIGYHLNVNRELLEVLKEALDALGGNDPQDLGFEDSICGKIRQAIAKAEGAL